MGKPFKILCIFRRGLYPGSRPLAALCAATVPVLAVVSYILPLFVVKIGPWANDIGPGWLKKLDDLLTCRISLAWAAYRVFDIKIAGQMLPDWPALDNIFVYLLYLTGPVMVVLVCAEIALARMMLALASPAWSVELNRRHSIVP